MKRANHIAIDVNVTITQQPTGVGTFISKGEEPLFISAYADLFPPNLHDGDVVVIEGKFVDMFGDFFDLGERYFNK